ncbi:MAG: hypothetical protein PVF58_22815 [Candidatus Methanofastidiosia archaeon]|jgi:hypothetical protein
MKDLIEKQNHWLQTLQSITKHPIKVSKNYNGNPSKWISVEDAVFPVDYRTVLHNEVVIDIDSTKWKKVQLFAEIITETLNKLRIPYTTAYTGGRGVHFHIFFLLSETQKKKCNIDVMPKDLRMWLFEHILKEADISPNLMGPGKPFDTSCINWNDEGKGHLIRIFGGKKRTYKTVLSDIPEKRPRTDNIVFPDHLTPWEIPDTLFDEFIEHFKRSHKKRVKTSKRYHIASKNFTGKYLNLPCIKRILEGLPEGQRNAGAHILAIACRLDGTPKKEAEKVILDYAKTCSQDNISESEYIGWVNWIYSQKEHFWNCRFCKELGLCEKKCQFHEAAYKDTRDFLKDPDLIKRIDKILGKRIKKDRKNRMLVFFVCLSAYGSNPLNLFLKGESSIGKTHIAKSVAEYFPAENVWFIGDMSPKALIHEHGTFENKKVYISLQNKILVFMETPRKETLEMLKPILSHDREEIEYKIADKKMSGQLGTKNVIIKGWPATIFCTTDHKYLEELSTRSMVATPEVSQEKIAEVLEYKGEKYATPWVIQEVDKEELLFKKALQQLKTGFKIGIPYGKQLAHKYNGETKNEPRIMRDFDKLMGLIEMSAFLHQYKRLSFCVPVNGSEQEFCIATEADLLVGMSIFESVRETTVTGLPQCVLDFYEHVVMPLPEVTYRALMDQYTEYYGRTISQVHLKNKYTDPLVSTGYLFCDTHPEDKRKKLFEKLILPDEMKKKIKEYHTFVLKDVFSEDELNEYLDGIKKIVQNNNGCDKEGCGEDLVWENGGNWFYTDEKDLFYFLEDDRGGSKDIKEKSEHNKTIKENEVKKQCLIGNSEQMKLYCEVGESELIDIYDEETVLQQIPQDDTKIEDVTRKFKGQSKVMDTIGVLKEKGEVILGQGYIRRPGRLKDKIDQYDEETVLQMIPEGGIEIKEFINRFENPNKVVDTLYILEKKGKITASQGYMRKVTTRT